MQLIKVQRISVECSVRNATSHLPSPKAEKQVAKRRWDNFKNQKAWRAGIKQCLQGTADSGTDELIEKNLYKMKPVNILSWREMDS